MSWYLFSIRESLLTGRLRIVLVFAILTVAPLISECLLRNNSVNGNSPKVSVKMKKNLMAGGGGIGCCDSLSKNVDLLG